MLFLTLLVSFAALSQAFVPAGRMAASTGLQMFAGGLVGSEGPELKNFDPLKFSENSPEWVPFFREAELKHGRIAMLATLGWVATDLGVKLPGDVHQVSSLEAHNVFVQSGALLQVLFWTSLLEIISSPAVAALGKSDRAPGYFAFDPLGFSKDAASKKKFELNELKNGRLAMLAFSGIVTQAALTGKPFPCKFLILSYIYLYSSWFSFFLLLLCYLQTSKRVDQTLFCGSHSHSMT